MVSFRIATPWLMLKDWDMHILKYIFVSVISIGVAATEYGTYVLNKLMNYVPSEN